MYNIYLQKLKLINYRNFSNLDISGGNNPVIITGENGSGKTNILEAISILLPGRGLRSSKLDDICQTQACYTSVYAVLQSKLGLVEIATSFKRESNKRVTEFNGVKIPNNELSKLSTIIWLTPQMESIFSSSVSDRRKFFDRIVYNFNPSHAEIVDKYEYYMKERSKILSQEQMDINLLKIFEEKMAELSVDITISRLKVLQHMQKAVDNLDSDFPKAILSMNGVIEDKISNNSVVDIVNFVKNELVRNRVRDKISNRTNFGVHKSEFIIIHKAKNILVKHCSTGEQKAMLIVILLAQVNYLIKEVATMPISLLDEVFVHLDNKRCQYLMELFLDLPLQLWITSIDLTNIELLTKKAQVIKL